MKERRTDSGWRNCVESWLFYVRDNYDDDVGTALLVNFGNNSPNFDSIPAKIGPANW